MSRSIEGADGPRSGSLKTCPWSWEQEQKGGQGNQKDQENPGQEESGYFANSAGAGGYGVAAVHGVVQGAAAGGLGATGIRGWFKRRGANAKPGDDHEENETADEPNEDGGPESNAPGDGGPQDQADEAGDARPDELQAHL
ncbi:hypothetical protein AUP68_13366 [Ilyonectria robusta]